jgi:hypothetical protein
MVTALAQEAKGYDARSLIKIANRISERPPRGGLSFFLLRGMSPSLALSAHRIRRDQYQLLGLKRNAFFRCKCPLLTHRCHLRGFAGFQQCGHCWQKPLL